jgi:drug/metabolite transporter (DMT)-like permease
MFEKSNLSSILFFSASFFAIIGLISIVLGNAKRSPEFNRQVQKIFKICLWLFYLFFYLLGLSVQTKETIWVMGILGGLPFIILLVGYILGFVIKKNEKLRAYLQTKLKLKQKQNP